MESPTNPRLLENTCALRAGHNLDRFPEFAQPSRVRAVCRLAGGGEGASIEYQIWFSDINNRSIFRGQQL